MSRPVVLCILDGIGWGRRDDGDAVALAQTPVLDGLMAAHPWCLLQAHGTAVGLPSDGDMGNSEVGHNAMGAGRVFDQGAKLVDLAIRSGRIFDGQPWHDAMDRARAGGTLHVLGLLSDGNVHSHVRHLHALLDRAQAEGATRVRIHVLTDGRDVEARSSLTWLVPLETSLATRPGDWAIATGGGRMHITMDRYEADWPMVKRGWDCHVHAQGRRFASASEAVRTLYAEDPNIDDQYLPEFVVGDFSGMEDGDAVLLTNFRGDRAVEICQAFDGDGEFAAFDRGTVPDVSFAGMMQYDGDLNIPASFLVAPPEIDDTVAENLSAAGKTAFATSETQKYGHVTYFFNGNRSSALPGETWKEVPSFDGPADERPEMKAAEVANLVADALSAGGYDLLRCNLANGDMVGHTGKVAETISAVEHVDGALGTIATAARQAGAILLVTADHGNAEEMFKPNKTGGGYAEKNGARVPSSSHSLNPVPFVLVDPNAEWTLAATQRAVSGGLSQIGATLLTLCGVAPPRSYLPTLVRETSA